MTSIGFCENVCQQIHGLLQTGRLQTGIVHHKGMRKVRDRCCSVVGKETKADAQFFRFAAKGVIRL